MVGVIAGAVVLLATGDTTSGSETGRCLVVFGSVELLAKKGLSEAQAQRLQGLLASSEAELQRLADGRHEPAKAA